MKNLLALDEQICFALYRASRGMIRAYGPILKPLGLTYPQYLVMLVLWEQDDLAVKDIGERLALDSATLTPLLKKLEEQNLVNRERLKEDERVVVIKLTKMGRDLRKKAETVPLQMACRGGLEIKNQNDLKKIAELRAELHALADKYL